MIKPSTIPSSKATMTTVKSSDEMLSPVLSKKELDCQGRIDELQAGVLSKKELAFERRLNTLDKHGVTDERLAKELDEGLKAVKVEEETVDGRIITTEVPDYVVREKYLDKAMKARDWYSSDVKVTTAVDVAHRVVLSKEDREHLMLVADRLHSMNRVLEMGDVQDGEIVFSHVDSGDG